MPAGRRLVKTRAVTAQIHAGLQGGEADIRTFGNSCEAENEGSRIISFGHAGRLARRTALTATTCTREYAPVRGQRGRDLRRLANSCEAESTGYGVVTDV